MYTLKNFINNLQRNAIACSYIDGDMINPSIIAEIDELLPRKYTITETNKLKAIEELQEIYQNIQDENETIKGDDGNGVFLSDGEWLEQLIPIIRKLLKKEGR